MKHQQHTNGVILASIPLDRRMKRYFRKIFDRMVWNNGASFACDKFKGLREALMGYRADRKRHEHRQHWLKQSGFHINGWLLELFRYMDTQPEYAMQLVKLYCGPNDPIVSVGQAAEAQHQTLLKAEKIRTETPQFMLKWLHHICNQYPVRKETYERLAERASGSWVWMHNFAKGHSYEEYKSYWHKWHSTLSVRPLKAQEAERAMVRYEPQPEMYVDFDGSPDAIRVSNSLERDLWDFVAMSGYLDLDPKWGGNGLSTPSWEFVASRLNERFLEAVRDERVLAGYAPSKVSFLDGMYVGEIHHIPKKGTVKRRSIAAPNRFLQMGMAPADAQLSILLRRLNTGRGRDCTYDQGRFDNWIVNRICNSNLYCGSVDLHQATDHLPFAWMKTIWSEVFAGKVESVTQSSWNLFCEVSEGAWLNQGYRDHWTVGQPLGALPSFRCLGLTHNLLLESLSFTLGFRHSPYCVLGDDVLMFNKKLRKQYIKLMQNVGVPLSLQKSYEGDLVEFAGKLFIRGQAPFYTTDHRALTWESLFDYQRATGVKIPFGNLPKRLRKKVQAICAKNQVPKGKSAGIYDFAFWQIASPRGSHVPAFAATGIPEQTLERMISSYEVVSYRGPEPVMAPEFYSGIVRVNGHPVTYLNYGYADKHGFKQRYRHSVPTWFSSKWRPVTTDRLVQCASAAYAAVHT